MLAQMKEGLARILSTDASSPLDRLPADARSVLRHLMERQSDLTAATLALTERHEETRVAAQRLRQQIEVMAHPVRAREHGRHPLASDDPRLQVERGRLQALQSELAEMQASLSARSEKLARLSQFINRLTRYVESLQGHKVVPASSPTPRMSRSDPRQAVEQARREIARLRADLREIEAAPHPSDVVKMRARQAIEALAARGRPDVDVMVAHGETAPAWPTLSLRVNLSASVANPEAAHPIIGLGHAQHADTLALMAWLHQDAFIAKLEAEIEEQSDDARALTDEARASRVAEIKSAILAAEREEEAVIRLTERDGSELERRVDADPRAVLSISSEAPAPTE
jgi:hypothetical protein